MSVLGGDVRVPEQPLQDEHSQAQGVAVALERDQLPEDRLRTSGVIESDKTDVAWSNKKAEEKTLEYLEANPQPQRIV